MTARWVSTLAGLCGFASACGGPESVDRVTRRQAGDTLYVQSSADDVDGPVPLQEIRRISMMGAIDIGRLDAAAFAAGQVLATLELPPAVATGWVVIPDALGGWFISAVFEANTPVRVRRFGCLHFDRNGVVFDPAHPPAYMLTEPTPDGIAPGRIRTVGRDGAGPTTAPRPNRLVRHTRQGRTYVMESPGNPPT